MATSCLHRWSTLVEWMRYVLYHKDRATSMDASEEHGDLHSRIATLFAAGGQARRPEWLVPFL